MNVLSLLVLILHMLLEFYVLGFIGLFMSLAVLYALCKGMNGIYN